MTIEITTAARRILREYRIRAHMGGNLHYWADGSTRWMTSGSYFANPGADYLGSLVCDSRDRKTLVEIQTLLDGAE